MSDIRFNNWLHQSGTGGVYQDGSGNVGIGTSVPSATLDVEGTINANTAVISGNLTVEGVLTYDDVTSIDSVGVVTARDGIHVTSGSVGIGTDNPTSALEIRTTTTNSATHYRNNASNGGAYFGVRATDLGAASAGEAYIYSYNSAINLLADGTGDINFATGGTGSRLHITSSGEVKIPDDGKFVAGAGDDLQMHHSSNNSFITHTGPGQLFITNETSGQDINFRADNGGSLATYMLIDSSHREVKLNHAGSLKLATKSTGIEVSGATKTDTLEVTQEYPTIRPTLDLNFAATKVLDDRITFTRDSVGTYVGEDGLVKYASNNVPRFDHDPTTGESLGLLIEESRTNLFTYSEEFDKSAWSKTRTTVSANSITAPDGTLTADKIIENVGSNTDYLIDESVSSSVATYTYSFFAKAGERSHIRVSRSTGNQTTFVHYYTLENNGTATGGGNIVAYPNGWYRCYGQTEVTSSGNAGFAIRLENSSTNSIYNGDGSSGFYIWGAQYEQGSFATSYIPTSGSTVTRGADLAAIRRTNFTDFYNSDEGTIYCEFTHGVRPWHFCDADNSQSQRFFGFSDNSGGIRVGRNASGWTYLSAPTTGSYSRGDDIKSAVSYGPTSFSVGAFGQVTDSGTTNANTGIDRLLFYQDTSNPDTNGTIRALKYYNKRLPNSQLQGLTQQ